tara:strand:- start:4163 stop:5125 length:963 start_codon:yes stop_codon:yes gene_type:complete
MSKKKIANVIEQHVTHGITDASKLQCFMDCPRQYFYRYVLGWSHSGSNIHLIFGEGWHRSMEHILRDGYGTDSIREAYEVCLKYYREHFDETEDQKYFPKSPEAVIPALVEYCHRYSQDDFEVLHTEVAGKVPIDENRNMHFRLDAVCKDEKGIYVLEHKTASRLTSTWSNQWSLSMQVSLYTHALHMMYDPNDVYGVIVNGVIFRKNGNDYIRVPVRKSPEMMKAWWWNVLHFMDMLDWNFEELDKCTEDDEVMTAFPMNTQSCTKYFGCMYQDFCKMWPNPLQRADEPPLGFVIDRWNPADRDEDKKQVNLGDKDVKK